MFRIKTACFATRDPVPYRAIQSRPSHTISIHNIFMMCTMYVRVYINAGRVITSRMIKPLAVEMHVWYTCISDGGYNESSESRLKKINTSSVVCCISTYILDLVSSR